MCSEVVVLPASMCAMTPMLRTLFRSNSLAAMSVALSCQLIADSLPGEVGEGLVGLGHLDGVLALGHGLALLAVGGHQLVGEAQEHRPAGLAARGADEPADRQALLPLAVD